ncbi:MAG: flagellar assembly protein FliW [Verrucomicrobiales bacterium]|jgi:flagellar assembly factor FliW|nr:flagellar assembly protein FliW [Verrucomicrobiales bacterium]
MKCVETNVIEHEAPPQAGVIRMPAGLLGFENNKTYQLLASAEEAPFLWLLMADEPKLSFLVVEPAAVMTNYQPDVPDTDVAELGIESAEDALFLNIVTIHRDGKGTVNMKGPILVNRRTLAAKQVVPLNAGTYSLQHPLPAATA